MSASTDLHLLGINDMTMASLRNRKTSSSADSQEELSLFAARLAEILEAYQQEDEHSTSSDITEKSGQEMIQRRSLVDAYIEAQLTSFRLRSENSDLLSNDYSLEDTEKSQDSLSSQSAVLDGTQKGTSSAEAIVMAAGWENADLIGKINTSTTIEDRLAYSIQLRDKIIDALREAGYTAYDIGKPDKISIDGSIYDVIKASRGLGRQTGVQFLPVEASIASDSHTDAIFAAGESLQNLLPEISATHDPDERQQLALEFRQQLLDQLNANGYSATAHSSTDKIVVDGKVYDILRNLNSPGRAVLFQAARVS